MAKPRVVVKGFCKVWWVFCFLRPHWQHVDVPRLRVESELQRPAYTTATATWDPSRVCDLHHTSGQCWIPHPLSEARDRIGILMVPGRVG